MFDIFPQIKNWVEEDKPFALSTVIRTWGSAPRPIGSAMAVSKDSEMLGSVSGGCVEGAVIRSAQEILETKESKRLKFGVSDEEAWAVGLSCGGAIQVFSEPFIAFSPNPIEKEIWHRLKDCIEHNKGCILVTAISEQKNEHLMVYPNGNAFGSDPTPPLAVIEASLKAYKERKTQVFENQGETYFIQVFPRKSQLLIVGAAHITTDLVRLGNLYDFETIIIDPRGIFANKTQFSDPPDQLLVKWPEEVLHKFELDAYTYAVLLTHDPKIDDQALHILLQSEIAYIGALGSRKTHEKRVRRLTTAGFEEEAISRIHGPVGVNINAKRPKEIALSIMGEIIQTQNQFL